MALPTTYPITSGLCRLRLAMIATLSVVLVGGGCAGVTIQPDRSLLPARPWTYSDADWARTLRDHVRDGLVDYRGLLDDAKPLRRYYALIAETGPSRTPDQFQTRSERVAYWINAYNALVLLAVLERYPVSTMYDLSLPRLEYEYRFVVDGRPHNLAWIEQTILAESGTDVRTLFATSRAALGTPALAGRPYRADTLDAQLTQAAAQGLDNPHLCRIDHASQSVLVWQKILNREADFLAYWRSRHRTSTGFLFNALLDLASPQRRRQLQGAIGYQLREIPFNRNLNEYRPGAILRKAP